MVRVALAVILGLMLAGTVDAHGPWLMAAFGLSLYVYIIGNKWLTGKK